MNVFSLNGDNQPFGDPRNFDLGLNFADTLNKNTQSNEGLGLAVSSLADAFVNPVGTLTGLLKPNGFDELASSLGLGGILGHTSASESNGITSDRINQIKQKSKSSNLSDEDYANTVLHGMGFLLAMHTRNYSVSSPRMKKVNQSDIDLIKQEIAAFLSQIESVYQVEKSTKQFAYSRSLPSINVNTNQNNGPLITVKLTAKQKPISVKTKTSIDSKGNEVETVETQINPILKWVLILFVPFGLVGYGLIKLIKKLKK